MTELENTAVPNGPAALTVGEMLVRAVLAHQVVNFEYYGGGRRTVEPHLVGLHEAGEVMLIGYQIAGFTGSGRLPGWRTFVLSEIDRVEIEDRAFPAPRPGFAPHAHHMVEIFARA